MSSTFAPTSSTVAEVLEDARAMRLASDDAERLILLRATEWAAAHPVDGPHDTGAFEIVEADEFRVQTLPQMAYDAGAEFALAIGMSHEAGDRLIHESMELRHRLPLVWERLARGELTAWRARRIAQMTIGHPDDVAAHVDAAVVQVAHKVGLITLERLIDEAMLVLYPEQREQQQLEELDKRHVTLDSNFSHTGLARMQISGEMKDVLDFNDKINQISQILHSLGVPESHEVRRAMAIGILADPAAALDLINGTTISRKPSKKMTLVVHLSRDAIEGTYIVGRLEKGRVPLLVPQIREWAGRGDTHLTVTPVIDLSEHENVEQYELPDRLKLRIDARDHVCVFPFCNRVATRCDHDHTIPFHEGGASCECNVAALCRRHHRMKTHRGWSYSVLELGTYLWLSPAGRSYFRDNTGSTDVTGDHPPDPGDGCFRRPSSGSPPSDGSVKHRKNPDS
ncbi:HNH endonuclease [Nocardioides sp. JQ2195]|uniref:HNH endonuclease signature motif containing protein n=1 Tax=Nocardioides sp. JQ2195 TaxID=2592334 RepID=UPI00143E85A1|nr:HNH endonuclease signature motif containing protein [Nocardioides sp. JQ2195]QIX26226.1 HNH endonuclease [Nocardioides sp. JQ2195]